MAKQTVKQDQTDLGNEVLLLSEIQREWADILSKQQQSQVYDKERLKSLKSQYGTYDKLADRVREITDKFIDLNDEITQHNESIKDSIESYDDMDDALISIGSRMGKNSAVYEGINQKILKSKEALGQISSILQGQGQLTIRQEENVMNAAAAYKGFVVDIADASRKINQGNISQEEYNQLVKSSYENLTGMVDLIDDSTEAGQHLKSQFEALTQESESFYNASMKSLGAIQSLDEVMGSFSGIPALSELNTLIKTNTKDTLAFKAAVFALGAALGAAAFEYFGAPITAAMERDKQIAQARIDSEADIAKIRKDAESIPAQISQERDEARIESEGQIARMRHDADFISLRVANEFSAEMQSGAAAFERAAKTALFGKGIGSVGYGAAQLNLIGVGADTIASAMETTSTAMGKMPSAKLAADMAVMAERTGASVDEIVSINEMFQRIDGTSESTAMNLSEGLRNMAEQANIGLGGLMREIADASKDALSYQIKSGPALAKQVAYAQSLGVNFGDIAKAGKSMVMNYSDSIKKEMQLSAMLGKNVDLSEVRAKFASGDTAGALSSLQAQGLDPAQMDMFAQEALSEALGGLDLNTLSKISQNTGKNVALTAADAKAGNQEFISRTQAAEVALNTKQAVISSNSAIIDEKLSQKIADSYMDSDEYRELKMNQSKLSENSSLLATNMEIAWKSAKAFTDQMVKSSQLDFTSGLKQAAVQGTATILGGVAATLISNKVTGAGGGGLLSMFGRGGANAPGGPSGGSSTLGAPAGVGGNSMIPGGASAGMGGGAVVESIAEQVQAVEAPLEKAMSLGDKLKDFGKGLGSFLASVGKGIGDAIGGILQGVGKGLAALGTPQVLLGVGAMIGLGASLWVAGKGLQQFQGLEWETIGMAFTTLLGLGAVGALLGTVSPFIIAGAVAITAMSVAFAAFGLASGVAIPNLMQFQSLNAGALTSVGGGLVKLAKGLGAFGAGAVMAAIGKFFGGGTFDELKDISGYANPIQITADAVQSLANAFGALSGINTKALNDVPWGKMGDFASEGGKFVLASSGGGSFALSKDTTDNIKKMATNTDAMVKLNNTMVKLLKEGFFGTSETTSQLKLYIDGKDVKQSLKRYTDNTKGGKKSE